MHIADLKDAYEVSKVAYDDVKRRRDVCYERLIELRARAKDSGKGKGSARK